MLHKQRKRQLQIMDEETAGSFFWINEFSDAVRLKIWYAFLDGSGNQPTALIAADHARAKILRDEGLAKLTTTSHALDDLGAFLRTHADDELVVSIVEAMLRGLDDTEREGYSSVSRSRFVSRVNEVLMNERVAFELIGDEMVEKESQELHAQIVAPLLYLLSGRAGWDDVEAAYQKSLKELSDGESDDAITDAGTALQGALKQRGCSGNALGPLLTSARQNGILAPHDQRLSDGIGKLIEWVSADRSALGDGHRGASPATPEDAWLTVHVVGALILRLTSQPRPT
jgi:hypothetical protein